MKKCACGLIQLPDDIFRIRSVVVEGSRKKIRFIKLSHKGDLHQFPMPGYADVARCSRGIVKGTINGPVYRGCQEDIQETTK